MKIKYKITGKKPEVVKKNSMEWDHSLLNAMAKQQMAYNVAINQIAQIQGFILPKPRQLSGSLAKGVWEQLDLKYKS